MSLSTEESDISHRGICSWESALFKRLDDFNGCGYFHIILLLIALRHICRWFEEDRPSGFVTETSPRICSDTPVCPTQLSHVDAFVGGTMCRRSFMYGSSVLVRVFIRELFWQAEPQVV